MATIDFQYPQLFSEISDMNFLKGTVKSVDEENDKMKVDIDGVGEIDAIEVFYHCENESDITGGASAFRENDRVLLINPKGRCNPDNWDPFKKLRVIGFEDGVLRLCVTTTTTTTTAAPQFPNPTAWHSPSTCSSNGWAMGSFPWNDPEKAKRMDRRRAYVTFTDAGYTDRLRCRNFWFQDGEFPAVPPEAIIHGIEVRIKADAYLPNAVRDSSIRLKDSGQTLGDTKTLPGFWSTNEVWRTYGGSTDDWNAGLGSEDMVYNFDEIEVTLFSEVPVGGALDYHWATIDVVQIRVYWHLP